MKNIISIKAAVLQKKNQNLVIKKIFHKNNLSKNQVLVKIFYTGVCGSQLGEISGIKGKDKYLPHLLGHEATGEILKVAKNIFDFKKKDKVILHWQKNSKKDSFKPNYFDEKNKKMNAGWVTTFNNLAIVSKNRITKLPKCINIKEGVLFGCSLTTSYGAVFNDSNININIKNKVLINGFGMIGQSILSILNNNNQNIFVLENNDHKIKLLLKNFPKVICIRNINELNQNNFDYVYETTGNKKIIEKSYDLIKNTGELILIGVPKFNSKIKINTLGINYGKKIIGSYGGNIKPKKDLYKIINYVKKKNIVLKNLISGPYNFKDINKIIKNIKNGKIIKKPLIRL
jgi:S-(hydroxymethyl)glutathione dehydrogenase/alcohol dehydrogenase